MYERFWGPGAIAPDGNLKKIMSLIFPQIHNFGDRFNCTILRTGERIGMC